MDEEAPAKKRIFSTEDDEEESVCPPKKRSRQEIDSIEGTIKSDKLVVLPLF